MGGLDIDIADKSAEAVFNIEQHIEQHIEQFCVSSSLQEVESGRNDEMTLRWELDLRRSLKFLVSRVG